jgi:ligand-binding sensor domain-containing protein
MKYRLIFGLMTLTIGAMLASTVGASPAYQSAGQWRSYPTPARITALAASGDTLWAGTPTGLIRFNQSDGASVTYTTADGLTDNDISAVAIDPDGRPWVGAWDGNLSRFDGQAWQAIRLLEAPEDGVYLSAIAFDDLGQAWYGVYGYGVHGQGQDFTSANGLSESYVMAMAISGQEVWVGTRLGLSHYDGRQWRNFTPKDGLTGPGVTAVAIDPLGQVWAGTYESGLNRFDGQNWTGFTTADGLPDNRINAVVIDAAGQPWVATPKGVGYFDGQQWTTYTGADGLVADDVKTIAVDDDGHLWFGTAVGLTEFIPPAATPLNEPDFSTYTTADGLPGDKIRDIAFDTGGRAWVGAYEGGASLFDGQSWTIYTAGQGFFDPQKKRFGPTDDGLASADVQAILPLFDGRVMNIYSQRFFPS